LLTSAGILHLAERAGDFGIHLGEIRGDYAQAVDRRDRTVDGMHRALITLLRENGVVTRFGTASFVSSRKLRISGNSDVEELEFEHCIVATGSRAVPIPVPGADLPGVIDSDGALGLREAPARVVVIGGGAVGVEWAEIWRAFGSEVTILEALPTLVPTEEPEIGRELARSFTRRGITCHTSARVMEILSTTDGLEVLFTIEDRSLNVGGDLVLVAIGRRPNVAELGLDEAGVATERGAIVSDGYLRTSVPWIYAVGDVTGRSLLAHSATHQGLIAADSILDRQAEPFDPRLVPGAIFTHPEIASVGVREAAAVRDGLSIRVGRFPFAANPRAVTSGDSGGFVKLLADTDTHEILGVSVIGPGAADVIATASLALRLRARLEDLATTIHVHPTWSEALLEATWAALDEPIHVPRRRPRVSERVPT
jgi:dihydrolipoamide dehydrogenase